MFIHDNGKLHVMSNTRCGHTSMRNYFGFVEHNWGKNPVKTVEEKRHEWLNSTTRKVLVLRNPVDRWKSAEVFYDKEQFSELSEDSKNEWMRVHREPFLINISRYCDFEIIPFENLRDYLPWDWKTLKSNSNDIHRSEVEMSVLMREELNQYRYFRKNCKIISPEEWKELTP